MTTYYEIQMSEFHGSAIIFRTRSFPILVRKYNHLNKDNTCKCGCYVPIAHTPDGMHNVLDVNYLRRGMIVDA